MMKSFFFGSSSADLHDKYYFLKTQGQQTARMDHFRISVEGFINGCEVPDRVRSILTGLVRLGLWLQTGMVHVSNKTHFQEPTIVKTS